MAKDSQDLSKIVSIVKYAAEVESHEVTGIKDTNCKLWACYMAKHVTNHSAKEIASFFHINPDYMQNQIEAAAVDFLIDPESEKEMIKMCALYLELQANEH